MIDDLITIKRIHGQTTWPTPALTDHGLPATLAWRLDQAGFDPDFVTRFLPDWWDADDASHPAAVDELTVHLALDLGLDVNSVLDPDAEMVPRQLTR